MTKRIHVREPATIRLHWFNALSWGLLVASGLGIISGSYLRLVPAFWPELLQNLFGGNATLILSHVILGLVWMGVIVLFSLLRWRSTVWPFLRQVMTLTPRAILVDLYFMTVRLARLFGLMKNVPLPSQGRYNGAQRLLGTMIVICSVLIALSGVYMFFAPQWLPFAENDLYGSLFRWALVTHAAAVFLVLIGLIAHIYFAVIEEGEAMEGMKSGYLDAEFVRHHSPQWYEELKREGKA